MAWPGHFLCLSDLTGDQILSLLDQADQFRLNRAPGPVRERLAGRTVALIFSGSGFRTRASFEIAVRNLGADALVLPHTVGGAEPTADIARYLACWVDAIVLRTPRQADVLEMAAQGSVPVVNAMTSSFHPCEVLADAQTIRQMKGDLSGLKITFVGAGTNVCASWYNLARRLPLDFTHVRPPEFPVDRAAAEPALAETPGRIFITPDLEEGLKGSDVVLTDAWPRADSPEEAIGVERALAPYRIDKKAMALAGPQALLFPCPPLSRGREVTAEVIDSPWFAGFEAKKNLVFANQAVLASLPV